MDPSLAPTRPIRFSHAEPCWGLRLIAAHEACPPHVHNPDRDQQQTEVPGERRQDHGVGSAAETIGALGWAQRFIGLRRFR